MFNMLFQIGSTVMDTLSLLDIVTHDKFAVFLACNKTWRNQTKIRKICGDIILVLTGISHQGHGNKCVVEKISHNFVSMSKSKMNIKVGFPKFKLMNTKWMRGQLISSECPEHQQVYRTLNNI